MPIRTTIVGCGAAAQTLYRKPLKRLERQGILRVTALVDRRRSHAEAMRSSFPSAAVSDNLAGSLGAHQSDLALILSPASLHHEHSILALRHENHVLCEKPMAVSEAQCCEMIAAAREMDRVLAIGMVRRFFPAFAQLAQLIHRGGLGELVSFSYREGRIFDWDVKTPAGFTRQADGGTGILFDIGPHALDLVIWLFGSVDVVSCSDDGRAGVEGNVLMELRSPACSGSLQLSWDSPLKNELRIHGTRGEAVLRLDQPDKLAIRTASTYTEVVVDHRYAADTCQPSRATLTPHVYTESMYCQLIQVARAIRLGEAPPVGGEAGRACVKLFESARTLATPLEMSWLDPAEQQAYRTLRWAHS
jgi:predicted dehydrogenase